MKDIDIKIAIGILVPIFSALLAAFGIFSGPILVREAFQIIDPLNQNVMEATYKLIAGLLLIAYVIYYLFYHIYLNPLRKEMGYLKREVNDLKKKGGK